MNYQLRIVNTTQLIHFQINSSARLGRTAADGSGKPAGAKPTGHGGAGLRARRHRYPVPCMAEPRGLGTYSRTKQPINNTLNLKFGINQALKRKLFNTTLIELNAIAAAAIIGLSCQPVMG